MKRKTQTQLVMDFISENGESSISEIQHGTGILRPNIRRILGQGAKANLFQRIAPGVYVLETEAGNIAYVEAGDALQSLPRLRKEGWKFDMVFIDPPYFSKALIGGNRGIKDYDFIFARQFYLVMCEIANLVANETTHVYVMLSGAPTAQRDMKHYLRAVHQAGFKLCKAGSYKKQFKSGKPITNVRGNEASAEQLLLYTLSGQAQYPVDFQIDFECIRPSGGYQTEKAPALLAQLIRQSTAINQTMLDCFAGSGVSGDEAIIARRNAYLIDKNADVVENIILKRIQSRYSGK